MKYLFFIITIVLILSRADLDGNSASAQNDGRDSLYTAVNNITDGMYPVIDEVRNELIPPKITNCNYAFVKCSELLIENNDNEFTRVIIDTADYVPLILKTKAGIEQQTETKKRVTIELTRTASEKLEKFTTTNLNKRIALIIGSEVISMHKIKVPITSGQFQISYCGPDMCEFLESKLINDVDSTDTK